MGKLLYKGFGDINLSDPFFDSLREDYPGFDTWFNKKAHQQEMAYVYYDKNNAIIDFLYLKLENEAVTDVTPSMSYALRLKVGTLKINPRGTNRGERIIKILLDTAMINKVREIYTTVFPKHTHLIALLQKYGFELYGRKGEENVYVKRLTMAHQDIYLDYPMLDLDANKYILSIYPVYHTEMFPDSMLKTERKNEHIIITDSNASNNISKIYICKMQDANQLNKGDLIVIYRTSDGQGPAKYRSVVTSVCTVEEIKYIKDFANYDDYYNYVKKHSIFDDATLRNCYKDDKGNYIVIRMLYNFALDRRITLNELRTNLNINSEYWGFFKLTDAQFVSILDNSKDYENYIIDKTRVCQGNI